MEPEEKRKKEIHWQKQAAYSARIIYGLQQQVTVSVSCGLRSVSNVSEKDVLSVVAYTVKLNIYYISIFFSMFCTVIIVQVKDIQENMEKSCSQKDRSTRKVC